MKKGKTQAPPLVNKDDFKSLEYRVFFENLATSTSSPTRPKLKADSEAELLEVGEQEVVLDIPHRRCGLGHHVLIQIECTQGQEVTQFSATGKVTKIEHLENGRDRVDVLFLQYDKKAWGDIRSKMASRQDEIFKFMNDSKGY